MWRISESSTSEPKQCRKSCISPPFHYHHHHKDEEEEEEQQQQQPQPQPQQQRHRQETPSLKLRQASVKDTGGCKLCSIVVASSSAEVSGDM